MNELIEKQVEEMANDIARCCPNFVDDGCELSNCVCCLTAYLYKAGYRKQNDIANEILDTIMRHIKPFENAEDYHSRQAFEKGDTREMQIHQYAENILGHFSDYITEMKEKYLK